MGSTQDAGGSFVATALPANAVSASLALAAAASNSTSRDRTGHRRAKPSLANIAIPSFFLFQAQTPPKESPVRRKPLPLGAAAHIQPLSRRATLEVATPPYLLDDAQHRSFSLGTKVLAAKDAPHDSDSSNTSEVPELNKLSTVPSPAELDLVVRDLDINPHGHTPTISEAPVHESDTPKQANAKDIISVAATPSQRNDQDSKNRDSSHTRISFSPRKGILLYRKPFRKRTSTMTSLTSQISAAGLQIDITQPPKSPSKLGSFFGWKSRQNSDSSTATISPTVASSSSSPAPQVAPGDRLLRPSKTMPISLDIPKANASAFHPYYVPGTPSLPTPPASSSHVADLEQELREISQELANSIKREMELEDEVERWRSQSQDGETNRRTSDYYSDSGASSTRFVGDSDNKIEEAEKMRRRAEQEKAQMRLELNDRMAEVLRQRRLVEDRMHLLEDHVRSQAASPSFEGDRVRQLEITLDDAKRKLAEERQFKENMEDLVRGMHHEIEQYRNERDNLRDEVVPQLKSKVSSLEMFVSEGKYFVPSSQRQSRVAEEDSIAPLPRSGTSLSRSMSTNRRLPGSNRGSRSNSIAAGASPGLGRSGSIKEYTYESREQLTERVRDMEIQREALHKALKNLLERQRWQATEYSKKIKQLENERDKAMSLTPRRTAFHREVKNLREEVTMLRRRADEALDQKWNCEKGLGGLKMDLDRAQQETSGLRSLMKEQEVSVPDSQRDIALTKAYEELETTRALSLVHIKGMASSKSTFGPTLESTKVLNLLKQSISDAESDRVIANKQAEKYREQARKLQMSEMDHLGKERTLAAELLASTSRMDELAAQVKGQLDANSQLKQRLVDTVSRGERDQETSAKRIAQLQGKLKNLEDQLIVAQQHSEEIISTQEEEFQILKEASNRQLQRSRSRSILSLASGPPTPSSTLFTIKSPRLDMTSTGAGRSMAQVSQRPQLEQRVRELEKALHEAEMEMSEVVGRMNRAQIDVAELQSERDDALLRSRRFQVEIVSEREKVKALMARSR